MDNQRIIKIIVIVLIIAGVSFGGYFIWKWISAKGGLPGILTGTGTVPTNEIINTREANPETENASETETQEPQTLTQKLSILINSPVFEYWLASKDNSLYFANPSGQIIKVNNDNTRQMVSSQVLSNLHSIKASNDGSLAIVEFNYPGLPTLSIFTTSTTNWQPLPSGAVSAAISPDSKKIAYTDKTSIKTLDLTTNKTSEVQKMSQVGLRLDWLNDAALLFHSDTSIETRGYVYSFDFKTKTLKTLINGENGLSVNWAKDGKMGIKINTTNRKPKTSLIDNLGSNIANFTFLTLPEKCLIESQKIYCGIPQNIRSGATLPDDYYNKSEYFIDDIFELDLPTGKITKIFDGNETALDAYNLKIKDSSLLFINRYDNKLYSLNLQ